MAIATEVQGTVLGPAVELFIIDPSGTGQSTSKIYFQPSSTTSINFSGDTYIWLPAEIKGVSISADTQASPSIGMANVDMAYAATLVAFDDLLGASLTYIRTFERYLNNSNGSERFSTRTYDIKQKTVQNKTMIEFSLGTFLDRDGMKVPARRATDDVIPGFGVKN